jgi:hypothetical protein
MSFSFACPNLLEICRIEPIFFSANGAIQPEPTPSAWVFAREKAQALKGRTNKSRQFIQVKSVTL